MASHLRTFREHVQHRLGFVTGFQTVNGKVDAVGPSDRDFVCVWSASKSEREIVIEAEYNVFARIFIAAQVPTDPYAAMPTDDLEDLLEEIERDLSGQALDADGGVWVMRVVQATIDPDVHGMEIRIMGIGANEFQMVA